MLGTIVVEKLNKNHVFPGEDLPVYGAIGILAALMFTHKVGRLIDVQMQRTRMHHKFYIAQEIILAW